MGILKNELNRSLFNYKFLLSLILGCIISVLQFINCVIPISNNLVEYMKYKKGLYHPGWLFSSWIGGNVFNIYTYLFYIILPILAVLPFGVSGFSDIKSGYIKSIFCRMERKKYYISKYFSVFISGSLVIAIPLLLNLILSSLALPALIPQAATSLSLIRNTSIFCDIYYTNPFIHAFLFILLDSIFGGLFAVISLFMSDMSDYKIIVLLTPFLIYIFIYTLMEMLGFSEFAPFNFLKPGCGNSNIIIVLIYIFLISLITCYFYIIKGKKKDVF